MTTAVVVGSGPNGLVAGLVLARAGWDVTVLEAQPTPGGGTRTEQLTLPGVLHDVCSAIHPLAVASPAFTELDGGDGTLARHGLEWIHPDVPLAHPLDGGRAAILTRDLDETARGFGRDAAAYSRSVPSLRRNRFAADRSTAVSADDPTAAPDHARPLRRARRAVRHERGRWAIRHRRSEGDLRRALRSLDASAHPCGERRLRIVARGARPHGRVADGTPRLATDRRRARGDARAGGRSDRV